NDTATTEIYTLSLHDALPIFHALAAELRRRRGAARADLERVLARRLGVGGEGHHQAAAGAGGDRLPGAPVGRDGEVGLVGAQLDDQGLRRVRAVVAADEQ